VLVKVAKFNSQCVTTLVMDRKVLKYLIKKRGGKNGWPSAFFVVVLTIVSTKVNAKFDDFSLFGPFLFLKGFHKALGCIAFRLQFMSEKNLLPTI
jgi:hypothetical protein